MAIPSNSVNIGDATKKSHYDTLYNNAILCDTGGTPGGTQSIPGAKSFTDGIDVETIRAIDGTGLNIEDDGGNLGIFVKDGGNVGIKTSSPTVACSIDGALNLIAASTETRFITIGDGRSGDGISRLSLVSDATYTDYALRLFRGGGGANAESRILHRGTGDFKVISEDAASLLFLTSNTEKFKISASTDDSGFGGFAGGVDRDINVYLASDTRLAWSEAASTLEFYISGTPECTMTTNAIRVGGGVASPNRTCYIDMASDAAIRWDESADEFYLNKSLKVDNGIETDGTKLKTKVITIGDWNMNVSAAGASLKSVAHGLSNYKNARIIDVIIRDDADSVYNPLYKFSDAADPSLLGGGVSSIDSTNVNLRCRTGGFFDGAAWDATSYNRGWITITYEA